VTAIWLKRWSWGGEVILGVVKLVGKNSGWGRVARMNGSCWSCNFGRGEGTCMNGPFVNVKNGTEI
jgi:hypothetical protein